MNQNLNALVIENHSELSDTLQQFTRWGLDKKLFAEVELNMNSLHETPDSIDGPLLKNNCIIIQSEFLYKDQLETFADFFANKVTALKPVPKKYRFYIFNLLNLSLDWMNDRKTNDFKDPAEFLDNLRRIVDFHEVYSVEGFTIYSVHKKMDGKLNGYSVGNWR